MESRAGYPVLRLLATGTRSRVWVIEGDRVLKVLDPPIGPGQPVTEVEALHRARGDHVVELLDVTSEGDELGLVFPRLGRGSLTDVISVRDVLDAGEAVTVLAPVAGALARMHAAGMAHGALSAGSILFAEDGAPVLTGFGSAVLFDRGLPEVRLERLDAVAADRAALLALAEGVLLRVGGSRAAAAHELADRLRVGSAADLEDRLAHELFELAAARPVVLDTMRTEPTAPARSRVVAVSDTVSGSAPDSTDAGLGTSHGRSFSRGNSAAILARVLESGPVDALKREARRRWSGLDPRRRRLLLAGAAASCAVMVLIAVLPGPDAHAPAAAPSAAATETGSAGAEEDPLVALEELLARRGECMRALSVLCLTEVDQDGSAAAAQDRAWLDGVVDGGRAGPVIAATDAVVAERLGDSVLITLAPDSDPASILLMRTEAGWRIRDYLAAEPGG